MTAGEFAGRVAVVVGGTSGIGLATAELFARRGATVVIGGERNADVAGAVETLASADLTVDGLPADVTDAAQLDALAMHAAQKYGGLDVVVYSAGIQRYGTVTETSEEEFDRVLAINARGLYLTARATIPHLRARGGGAIVTVGSTQAHAAQAGAAAYVTSKGALHALTRALAVDHAADGIRANCVCPGSVDTPMLRSAAARFAPGRERSQIDDWAQAHPLGRVATPAEVAEAIVFLASERAAFVTGSELRVDGGQLARAPTMLPPQ